MARIVDGKRKSIRVQLARIFFEEKITN